jgi:hypothetical protein
MKLKRESISLCDLPEAIAAAERDVLSGIGESRHGSI